MSACAFCGTALDPKMRIVKDTECPSCTRDLHACVQCRFFDRSAHNMCRESQAEWVTDFAKLAVCKPFVEAVHWIHLTDAEPHQFPHCGLFDEKGNEKPALQRLRALREKYLS